MNFYTRRDLTVAVSSSQILDNNLNRGSGILFLIFYNNHIQNKKKAIYQTGVYFFTQDGVYPWIGPIQS